MRLAFLIFLFSFFQFAFGETLNKDALKACARHLGMETSKSSSEFADWNLLPEDLSQDLEATVLVRVDANLVPPNLMQSDFRYKGIVSPQELTRVDAGHRTVFLVVHGSRENLTSLAHDLKNKCPARALSYRILLSRPQPAPDAPPFFRAEGLSLSLAEALETCFFTSPIVTEPQQVVADSTAENEASGLTVVTKETRDKMIAFLRAHASSEDLAKINIGVDFGLLNLIKDIMVQASGETKAKIDKALAKTEPKKSDGTGFRANSAKAVERVLNAWTVMVESLDESLLADPFSDKTLFALDKVIKEKVANRSTKPKRKST